MSREQHTLAIHGLHASVDGFEILRGVDLEVRSGAVHVLMGPNGSGKSTLSHVLMGRADYEVTRGSVTIDGEDLLGLDTWQRAKLGLFLAMQYPVEVPGVPVGDLLAAAVRARGGDAGAVDARLRVEAERLDVRDEFLTRGVNDEFSGGEKKRHEILQMAMIEPRFAVLDETDSGLDIDALKVVSNGVNAMRGPGLGVLLITHYTRILRYIRPDVVHVMFEGRIARTGGPELADYLEEHGYVEFGAAEEAAAPAG